MKIAINRKVFLCLCLSLFVCHNLLASVSLNKNSRNAKAVDFSLESLKQQGKMVSLKDFEGKPIIVFFFTTWCPYCVKRISELSDQQGVYKSQQIELLLINVGESRRKVESFIKDRNISLDILLDADSNTAREYNVIGVPTCVLVDKNGIVRFKGNELPRHYLDLLNA